MSHHSILFVQIRKSPQARAFFRKSCKETDVPPLQLLSWVKTRWASLFDFLDRILLLQPVYRDFMFSCEFADGFFRPLTAFVQGADDSDKVPDLQGKYYSDFKLMKRDWEKLKLMHEVLRVSLS